jgi:RluA family pseudouridine synthase
MRMDDLPGAAPTRWTVDAPDRGTALVDFVFRRLSSVDSSISRSEARRIIVAGAARIDGIAIRRPGFLLKAGVRVAVNWRRHPSTPPIPDIRILFEDGILLIADKPAGLPTVPTADARRPSLVSLLETRRRGRRCCLAVHQRLDAATSGVILLVEDQNANAAIARQIAEYSLVKTYVALVARPARAVAPSFTIDAPLGQSSRGPAGRVAVSANGREAITFVRVLKELDNVLLVEARPVTGRKHQIRVHLASRGLPILGDPLHAPATVCRRARRMMLHAAELSLRITSALPPDFLEVLQREQERVKAPVAVARKTERVLRPNRRKSGLP